MKSELMESLRSFYGSDDVINHMNMYKAPTERAELASKLDLYLSHSSESEVAAFIVDLYKRRKEFKHGTMHEILVLSVSRCYTGEDADELDERWDGDDKTDLIDQRGNHVVLIGSIADTSRNIRGKLQDWFDIYFCRVVEDVLRIRGAK